MSQAAAIRLLPAILVDRIAAGEVIERPAAVVKELVENAIDSGAAHISVGLDGGGIERITVTDDGAGMTPAELGLAVLRHCTSKLADESLVRIATLGFRGEALPAIGAAARLCLTSRPRGASGEASGGASGEASAGAAEAWALRVEGGVVGDCMPAAGSFGTRVLVEDLFFATPARRKFLKSPRIEAAHAETVLRRLAMAAPRIGFDLTIDGRNVLALPPTDRAARSAALLAESGATPDGLLNIEADRDGMALRGFACAASVSRATAAGQYLVVNGRPVVDPVLRTAVRVAYRMVIAAGRHPVLALFLDIPHERVDVNVHPAKTELRFADAASVRGLVISALQRALGGGAGRAGLSPLPRAAAARIWYPPEPAAVQAGFAEAAAPIASLDFNTAPQARGGHLAPAIATTDHPLGAAVAQVLDTYVIAVAADQSLVLVDQHAAHERLTHETLRAQCLAGTVVSQRLLLPEVVELPRGAAARLLVHADMLGRLGLAFEAFGGEALLVRALPALLGSPDPAVLLRDLADELGADELADPNEASALTARLDAVIARLACHGSIRAGRRLQREEMDALLRQMEATPRAATCSHGRPTYLRLSRHELERMFGRT